MLGEYARFLEATQLDQLRPGVDIRFSSLGDIVYALAIASDIRRARPDLALEVLGHGETDLKAADPIAVAPGVRAAIRQNQQRIALYGETTLTALAEEQTSASRFTIHSTSVCPSTSHASQSTARRSTSRCP